LAALLFAALAIALGSAACGGDDDTGASTPAASPQPTATPSPTPPPKIGGSMILATTTSTQDSGLLDVLMPLFQKQTGIETKVIAVGTGAALEMGAKGDADAVLVHAPSSEKKYIDNGDLVGGKVVMHNDFIIVGPASDPAKVGAIKDLKAAMAAIAVSGPFISRGDGSGTNTKELDLWKAAGIDAKAGAKQREESGQGMGATLQIASQKRAYTLTDRATYLSLKKSLDLQVVFEGDPTLLNVYSAYVVNPEKFPKVKRAQAEAFVAFMVSAETQKAIEEFKKADYGQSLFFPDAGKSWADLGVK
jgi:tungstate transport system substrate-binding protein